MAHVPQIEHVIKYRRAANEKDWFLKFVLRVNHRQLDVQLLTKPINQQPKPSEKGANERYSKSTDAPL